ncbi:uncharacterized protein C630.12 isoform X1 [Gossypium hirsutum]|uniref:Uncharacterized protein C630.12 isoform X1 n=3 Tax=Gossypium TaxID=3633 RepID=A0ABM2ZDE1_GOSHI|nr:uncharacterized protein C630.12 isoform X1 [Gossypium hirsutum]TYH91843.1 hypothetical protein ES332_A13G141500v1 [Gossypium tomentosum]
MKGHEKLTLLLCLIWTATILYGEMFSFYMPFLFSCSWPHLSSSSSSDSTMNGKGYAADYVKVAVIADPQIMDKTSLRLPSKSLALEFVQFYTDLFMRRAFFSSILPFKPEVILFLGDYFDGGPYLSDDEWQESLSRLKHMFGLNTEEIHSTVKVYHLPGNHDIGYATLQSHKPEVVRRYEKEFGSRNYQFMVGKVEFVAIDAQTVDANQEGSVASATWNFVSNVSSDRQLHPRVLLSHIPLYRRDWTDCGPHRGSPIINQRIRHNIYDKEVSYQNYITEESSNQLLNLIRPVIVLSGHDHDQCTVTHESKGGPVTEHTLGTISWQQGNLYPSFMLLSARKTPLSDTSLPEEAVLTRLCFLPMQTHIYIWYIVLFVLTILSLLLWPTSGLSFCHHQFDDMVECVRKLINIYRDGTKEKNEDENYEYEMIWGADGSMHLVKKVLAQPVTRTNNIGPVERGNAVMRATAKKSVNQLTEVCLSMETNADSEVDPKKLPPRASKSKAKMVIQRFVRTFRMLILIAAVNVPLYMMFLFKDWIDK